MNPLKTGILLINLGTPSNATPKSVYAYLKQFLNDPRVIDLPSFIRYSLVNGLIIPFRYKKSAHAYQQIWTDSGSPLLTHSQDLVEAIRNELGTNMPIALGMRYGNPSIASAVSQLTDCQKIIAIPLFPHYSSAATGSAVEALFRVLGRQWTIPELIVKRDFFNNPDFIAAYASIIKTHLHNKPIDKLLLSYHGLPERHIEKSNCRATCTKDAPCPAVDQSNSYCYRAQCYETARLLANELDLNDNAYVVTFQSRLGRTPWIKPYTEEMLTTLRAQGVERIAIVCPSFVSDCLETLEEINIRARATWLGLGGKEFIFIPSLNQHPIWVRGLVNMIKAHTIY